MSDDDFVDNFKKEIGEDNWKNFMDALAIWDPFVYQFAGLLETSVINKDFIVRAGLTASPNNTEVAVVLVSEFWSEVRNSEPKEYWTIHCITDESRTRVLPKDVLQVLEAADWQLQPPNDSVRNAIISRTIEFSGMKNFDYNQAARGIFSVLSLLEVEPRKEWIFRQVKFGA